VIGELLALGGATLVLLASVGFVRLDHALARMHALSKASTLGVLLILVGAAVNILDTNDPTSILLAALLHVLTSPPASNLVSRATYIAYGMPAGSGIIDEGAEPLHLASARNDDAPGE